MILFGRGDRARGCPGRLPWPLGPPRFEMIQRVREFDDAIHGAGSRSSRVCGQAESPSWVKIPRMSVQPQRSTMSPSSNRATWSARTSNRLPVGACPMYSPRCGPGHSKYQREVVVVGEHDVGRECEVGERFEESAPVVFGALEPGPLTVGGIVIDDVFGEELTETVEVVGGDELAAE